MSRLNKKGAGSRKWWLRTGLHLTGMALSVIVARIVVRLVFGPGFYQL